MAIRIDPGLPKQLAIDMSTSFGKITKLIGPIPSDQGSSLVQALSALDQSVSYYNKVANSLTTQVGKKDKLSVPSRRTTTKNKIDAISRIALRSFGVIYKSFVFYLREMVESSTELSDSLDDEFDDSISSLEDEVLKSDAGKPPSQNRNTPSSKGLVGTPEDYSKFLAKYQPLAESAILSVKRHSRELEEMLWYSTEATFRAIQRSLKVLLRIAAILARIKFDSRKRMAPGVTVSSNTFFATIVAVATIVNHSVSANKSMRDRIDKEFSEEEEDIEPGKHMEISDN